MLRSLLLALLALATLAEASAQTTPATTTAKRSTTTKKTVKPAPRKTTRTTKMGNTSMAPRPAPEAAPAPKIGPGGNGAVGSTATADGKGQGVYAAPGEPVNVPSGEVEGYRGAAPKQNPRKGNTLTPSSSK